MRGIPVSDGDEEVKDILGLSSLVWVPVPTEAILRGASLFHLPHPCIIPRTLGPEETGRPSMPPAPKKPPLLGKHSPLSSKYLIEMRKTLWLIISLKTKGQCFSLLYPSVFVPLHPPPSRQVYMFPEVQLLFLTNLIFFNYKSNTYLGFSIIFKKPQTVRLNIKSKYPSLVPCAHLVWGISFQKYYTHSKTHICNTHICFE